LLIDAQGRLSPGTANARLAERVKKIGKINTEIAGWLQVCHVEGVL